MAAGQMVAGLATGNLGFIGESAHNAADAASFDAKRRAMDCHPLRARRLRRLAATVLATGGIVGVGGGAYHMATGENEDARTGALVVAVAGATINTFIARRTHGASHGHDHDSHAHHHGAHEDSKLHAMTDAGTGWLYVGGLMLEHKIPGAANVAVMSNGAVSSLSAYVTFKRINNGEADHHGHDH